MGINGKNDAELVRKSLGGCKKSFGALYDRYLSLAMLVAAKIVTDQHLAERKQLAELVLEAVNLLSPAMKRTTLLYYYQNYNLAEIAAVLGVSNNVVRTRLHRARVCLRTCLSKAFANYDIEIMSHQRRKAMMQVEILDVMHSESSNAILIIDKDRTKILPIFVGKEAGMSIARWKKFDDLPRPFTYELMANLLVAVKVEVEHVRVESIKEGIFYAVVRLKNAEDVAEVDARPSDAINLALRTDSPIYATEEVMELAVDAPPEAKEGPFESLGIAQLANEMEMKYKKRHSGITEEHKKQGEEYIKSLFKTAKDK